MSVTEPSQLVDGGVQDAPDIPEPDSPLSEVSLADSPAHRRLKLQTGQDVHALQAKRRRAQMRLVSLKRGSVKPRTGEPRCLQMFVDDLGVVLQQPRRDDGRFASLAHK